MSVEADSVTRQARISWDNGQFDLFARSTPELADRSTDASAFLCAVLPLAMRLGRELCVEGAVSDQLLGRTGEIQDVYRRWDPTTRLVAISAMGQPDERRAGKAGVFFSRGVDSLFAAAWDREGPRALDALVFADGVEPRHDGEVRREEIRRAGLVADELGLPLVVVETNVRLLTDIHGTDWEDVLAAGLAFVAHSLAGSFDRMTVPSTDNYLTLDVCGSSPLLDPLFSTGRLAIAHDGYRYSRLGKIRWLAEHRPELVAHIKVCARENRPDNCGHCGKCLYTMMCLDAVDLLDRASLFPAHLDLTKIAAIRSPHLKSRIDLAELAHELENRADKGDVRAALLRSLRGSALPRRNTAYAHLWTEPSTMRNHRLNLILSLVLEGRPYPPLGDDLPDSARALVRLGPIAPHRAALSSVDKVADATVLGGMPPRPGPGATAVWLTADGLLLTRGMAPMRSPALRTAAAWLVEPLRSGQWRGAGRRAVAVARARQARPSAARTRGTAGARSGDAAMPTIEGPPDGYLHGEAAEGRTPLYVAWHKVGLGQVLTVSEDDPELAWCGPPVLLGYLDTWESSGPP